MSSTRTYSTRVLKSVGDKLRVSPPEQGATLTYPKIYSLCCSFYFQIVKMLTNNKAMIQIKIAAEKWSLQHAQPFLLPSHLLLLHSNPNCLNL